MGRPELKPTPAPKPVPKPIPTAVSQDGRERLQKLLAHAGVSSRRAAEEIITAGRVRVNGEVVTEMGIRANPATDRIEVDGKPIKVSAIQKKDSEFTYILMNKPLGVVSTAKDPQGRQTVLDLLAVGATPDETAKTGMVAPAPGDRLTRSARAKLQNREVHDRVYPVGRLDADSTGLILLTNDGDLTFRLTHPKFGVEKEYRVLVRGNPSAANLDKMRQGIEIEGEMTAPAKVEEVGKRGDNTWLRVTIHEGRKRQVRLMCAAVGHPVMELQRVRFGPMMLGGLAPGQWRHLAVHEVHALRKAVRMHPLGM